MELDTTFYVLGGVLVALALIVSYVGIRGKEKFPPSGGVMIGGLAVVGAVVIATGAYAVALAREEQEHREREQAAEERRAEAENEGAEEPGAAPAAQEGTGVSEGGQPQGSGAGGAAETYDVTSPEDGSLSFEPPEIQAPAATITLAYANPSPVIHNINLEVEGETIAESEDVTDAATEVTAELAPGEYLYYCSIPGHREGGMEGVLTVE